MPSVTGAFLFTLIFKSAQLPDLRTFAH